MLEFYEAYADYRDLMNLTEEMLRTLTQTYWVQRLSPIRAKATILASRSRACPSRNQFCISIGSETHDMESLENARRVAEHLKIPLKPTYGLGKVQIEIFEKTVESRLKDPTFITAYPTEVSRSRAATTRIRLSPTGSSFCRGREIANGFSELNDARIRPNDSPASAGQRGGDMEAMHFDADYIRALEHGMPRRQAKASHRPAGDVLTDAPASAT